MANAMRFIADLHVMTENEQTYRAVKHEHSKQVECMILLYIHHAS
jgi:hypothetical protein